MRALVLLCMLFFLIGLPSCLAQHTEDKPNTLRLAFYNLENLFYPSNDSLTADDEYTPEGSKYFTHNRYYRKLNNLSRVVDALSKPKSLALMGLCELENRRVVSELLNRPILRTYNYNFIHQESDDDRGIDLALVYDENQFYPISYHLLEVDPKLSARAMLVVKGVFTTTKDTLWVGVVHWPSNYGGAAQGFRHRKAVAQKLVEAVQKQYLPQYPMVLMGDFNAEEPELRKHFKALRKQTSYPISDKNKGTLWYRGFWIRYDHFVTLGNLESQGFVAAYPFLLTSTTDGHQQRPFRTYYGFKYEGGYSDHLPIVLEILPK